MPGCIVSATTASFRSVEKRRRRATPVMTSTFENVSDIGVCLGLYLGPPAKAGVRSKQGAVQLHSLVAANRFVFVNYPSFMDFVVANSSYCSGGEIIQLRSVPTSDNPECLVNRCRNRSGSN